VSEVIRDAILTGKVAPGDKLAEQELADQLGVSRVPVREAIRILEQQGLLVTRPRSGTYVVRLTPDELQDGSHLRAAMEDLAVTQAFERLDSGQWDDLCRDLRDLLAAMRESAEQGGWIRVIKLDAEWHTRIVDAAQNRLLLHAWRNLGLPIRLMALCRVLGIPSEADFARYIGEHDALLTVLAQRDLSTCREAVRRHVLLDGGEEIRFDRKANQR